MALRPTRQECGTCKSLDVKIDAAGKPQFGRGATYRCLYEVPPVALPDSITRSVGHSDPFSKRSRTYMQRRDGTTCPTWAMRETPGDA